jgi:hypothetical protein
MEETAPPDPTRLRKESFERGAAPQLRIVQKGSHRPAERTPVFPPLTCSPKEVKLRWPIMLAWSKGADEKTHICENGSGCRLRDSEPTRFIPRG